MRLRAVLVILALQLAFASMAKAAGVCEELFTKAKRNLSASVNEPFANTAINQTPIFQQELSGIVAGSQLRKTVTVVQGFNDRIVSPDAPTLEKLIRQETPYTVSLMVKELAMQADLLDGFKHLGLVIGDPHFGNFNTQPVLFQKGHADKNRYTVVDLDEVSIGVFALDFARYAIFLKARFGEFKNQFGETFTEELFAAYSEGLRQHARKAPTFVSEKLGATSQEIRRKVDKYAGERTDAAGKFRAALVEKGELGEFKVGNMKPEFLASVGFDPAIGNKPQFKKTLESFFDRSLKADFDEQVRILDIAIPLRASGGSAHRQRFLVSAEVTQDGSTQRMIVEFKENATQSAWEAATEALLQSWQSPAQRYSFGLRATMEEPGHFLNVVSYTNPSSFLMRARGNLDVEFKMPAELRELSLYDAYVIGLFHGGQGEVVSGPYRDAIVAAPQKFQDDVLKLSDRVLNKLAAESGLRIPR